jgi:TPR repeat protein
MGTGVPRGVADTARYYKMAADQGYAQAQKGFAKILETGQGVPKDVPLPLKYDRKAIPGHNHKHMNVNIHCPRKLTSARF